VPGGARARQGVFARVRKHTPTTFARAHARRKALRHMIGGRVTSVQSRSEGCVDDAAAWPTQSTVPAVVRFSVYVGLVSRCMIGDAIRGVRA
jgi:hypothetical protein